MIVDATTQRISGLIDFGDMVHSFVVAELAKMTKKVEGKEQIAQVAAISANNDNEIGKLLADAMDSFDERCAQGVAERLDDERARL